MKTLNKTFNKASGFTLIELVVVIVILGILAATAAPRFIDLQSDARTSTLSAVRGSMQSASNLVYSKSLISGDTNAVDATEVNNTAIDTVFGYPSSSAADTGSAATETVAAGALDSWASLLDLDGFSLSLATDSNSNTYVIAVPTGIIPPTSFGGDPQTITPSATVNCIAFYLQSSALNVAPITGVVNCI